MKKILLVLGLILTIAATLIACDEPSPTVQVGEEEIAREAIAATTENFTLVNISEPVHNEGNLVYDANTKVVYYYLSRTTSKSNSRAYMCPYYSENGKLCRFNVESNLIEEIG